MNPATHILLSWTAAGSVAINRRERLLVTLAGVVPDIDGAGLLFDFFSGDGSRPLLLWSKYHHILCHNIGFFLILLMFTALFSTKRLLTCGLVFITFHLHLICDIAGSKGPGGDQWEIPYLLPFSDTWQLTWGHQWELNAWPNFAITVFAIILTLFIAWKKGVSPVDFFSTTGNTLFVKTLRKRFGIPGNRQN